VNRQTTHINDAQSESFNEYCQGPNGKVREMLVVNRVELELVEHVDHIRHFDHKHAILSEQSEHCPDKAIKIIHMSEDIRTHNRFRGAALPKDSRGHVLVEERSEGLYATPLRDRGDIRCGLYPQWPYPMGLRVLQEGPVIASNVHDEASPGEAEFVDEICRELGEMDLHRLGRARQIHVLTKQGLRWHHIDELDQPAIWAEVDIKWKMRLWQSKLRGRQEVVR
jgi:hypothetical protein